MDDWVDAFRRVNILTRGAHSSTSETESSWRNYHSIHSGLRRGVMLRMYRKRVTWGSLWTWPPAFLQRFNHWDPLHVRRPKLNHQQFQMDSQKSCGPHVFVWSF